MQFSANNSKKVYFNLGHELLALDEVDVHGYRHEKEI